MPPSFRIHQTRSKPERILIKLMQGKFIIPMTSAPIHTPVQPSSNDKVLPVPEKKKTNISLKQIKQMVLLLQQTNQKDISKMFSPELAALLSIDESVNPDQVPDENELVEPITDDEAEAEAEDDDDILVIDV